MRWREFSVVFRREFLSRVRNRAFWISTLITPLFMVAITVLPTLFASKQKDAVRLGVQDHVGDLLGPIQERLDTFKATKPNYPVSVVALPGDLPPDSLDARVDAGSIDAYVILADSTAASGRVDYRARVTTNFSVQNQIERLLSEVLVAHRLRESGFDAAAIQELSKPVALRAVGVGKSGNVNGEAQFFLAFALFMLLYMMLVFHGQAIMRSVLEEKSSRIVEVIVSSLRPNELLLGKIAGVGAAGIAQMLIWMFCGLVLSGAASLGLLAMASQMPKIQPSVILHILLFFIIGFSIYACLFAIVGAMHNNDQEAQQYSILVMLPIISSAVMMPGILSAPSSSANVVLSLIPFMTPLTMLMRVSVSSVPMWQVMLGYALCIALIAVEVWIAARIYRVGILMYGKRPTFPELVKWVKYSM